VIVTRVESRERLTFVSRSVAATPELVEYLRQDRGEDLARHLFDEAERLEPQRDELVLVSRNGTPVVLGLRGAAQ
jgi:hypothetical protein